MTEFIQKKCSACGQELRLPKNIGGVLMECPTCGKKIYSDFKLEGARKPTQKSLFTTLFEMPYTVASRVFRFLFGK